MLLHLAIFIECIREFGAVLALSTVDYAVYPTVLKRVEAMNKKQAENQFSSQISRPNSNKRSYFIDGRHSPNSIALIDEAVSGPTDEIRSERIHNRPNEETSGRWWNAFDKMGSRMGSLQSEEEKVPESDATNTETPQIFEGFSSGQSKFLEKVESVPVEKKRGPFKI